MKDAENDYALTGATVLLMKDSAVLRGEYADADGNFRFDGIEVGRYALHITYVGYVDGWVRDVILSSGKEEVLNVKLESSAEEMEVVVITSHTIGQSGNEMATVSARTFSVAETNLYAGSRSDPARMASNFAGVQGADDSRNDIVVRGNSPAGVLWRVEGVDIFNPNHFNIPGTAGGPVSILNNKILANSDFYTGAFPAEFGNSIAGVFDLKLRNGNNQKHEFSGQFGFLGTEILSEGPIKKNKSSYLITYRYSTLALFGALGIKIGTDAIPHYQDGSFRLNFPMKKNFNLSLFGMGGMSAVDILISDQTKPSVNIYGENDRDQYFRSKMGVAGLNLNKSFSQKIFSKLTFMVQGEDENANHNLVYRHISSNSLFVNDSLVHLLGYNFQTSKACVGWYMNIKANNKLSFKLGVNADEYFLKYQDSIRNIKSNDTLTHPFWSFYHRWNADATAMLVQPYIQMKYKFSDALSLNVGWHAMYFSLSNGSSLVEPRIGLQYQFGKNILSVGSGIHSQIQSPYIYFYNPSGGTATPYNQHIGFTKSEHIVLGYQRILGKHTYMKLETYYQHLFEVPVTIHSSSFSLVNSGAGFSRFFPDTLKNTGTGENYGVEATLEKGFSKNYYFLVTLSLFNSFYTGSDGVQRNTDFNGQYAGNFVLAKEFIVKKKNALQLGTKITMAGGRWYGAVDTAASDYYKELTYIDSTVNTKQFAGYFRADLKINYRINGKKVSHEIGIDIVNLLDTKNILKLTYAPDQLGTTSPIRFDYQLGRLPLFYYKIDF